jgi:hypothetical protein
MTDSEVGTLRAGQLLLDRDGRKWHVLHEPRQEAGVAWVMVRCGDQALRLTYRNADGFRLRPRPADASRRPEGRR